MKKGDKFKEGAEARRNFEETMTKLFRAPKLEKRPKKKAASEKKKN